MRPRPRPQPRVTWYNRGGGGCVATPRIADFAFDDVNEAKLDRHRLTPEQVEEVLRDDEHVVVRNRAGRRASHLVVGRDRHGRCLAIPVEPTGDPSVWRPVTAWECKESERVYLRRRGRT